VANPLTDILSGHPIRAIQDVPGEKFVQNLAGRFASNIIEGVEQAPGGIYYLGKTAVTNPGQLPSLAKQMGLQTLQDFEHPLRRPGFTALDLLGIAGGVGAVAGRVGELGAVASRAGELPEGLQGLTQSEAAAKGFGRQYNRVINTDTGLPNPIGRQMRDAFLYGPAQQERLIRVKGAVDPNEGLTLANTAGLTTPDGIVTHGWWYSKDPLIRSAQKLIDHMYETHADNPNSAIWNVVRKGTPFYRTQSGRFSAAAKAYNLTIQKESKSEAAAFAKKWGTAEDPWHLANRMVAEGVTPQALTRAHQRWLSTGTLGPKLEAETRARLEMIPETQKLLDQRQIVDPETGTRRIVPIPKATEPQFEQYVNESRALSARRSDAARAAGVLNESSHYGRLVSPFSVVHTDTVPETMTLLNRRLGQLRLNPTKNHEAITTLEKQIADAQHGTQLSFDIHGEHDPIASGAFKNDDEMKRFAQEAGLFRVPYAFERAGLRSRLAPGSYYRRAYGGRKPRVPSTFSHPFKGAILRGGGGETNVARLLAESYTEAHRFLGLRAVRNRLLASAQLTPEKIPLEYRQLIRTDDKLPAGLNINYDQAERLAERRPNDALFDKETLSPEEMVAGGRLYEGIRQHLFPEDGVVANGLSRLGIDNQTIDKMLGRGKTSEFQPVPGYRWIDKRLLGGLERKNPLTFAYDNHIVAKALRGTDALNTIIRGIMLYLRPAYAVPNMLGNIGLNLVHQGALAPFHMARNYANWRALGPAEKDIVRVQMGEGVGESGFKQMTGLGQKVQAGSAAIGKAYGKVVDEPFRINAFLHEANLHGYGTAEELTKLLRDPSKAEDLRAVTNRANEAIINYERLGPGEESVARRLILFYPFIKGASRYANYFFKEHPLAAAAQSNLGELGQQRSEELLGNLPAYLQGIIPYGGSKDFPITGNPLSMGILNEPADLAKFGLNVISGHPNQGLDFAQNLAPVETSLLTLLTGGKYTPIGQKPGTPLLNEAWNSLAGGLPPETLLHRIQGKGGSGGPLAQSVYPDPSLLHALLQFGFSGGLTPRLTNRALANYKAYKERNPHA